MYVSRSHLACVWWWGGVYVSMTERERVGEKREGETEMEKRGRETETGETGERRIDSHCQQNRALKNPGPLNQVGLHFYFSVLVFSSFSCSFSLHQTPPYCFNFSLPPRCALSQRTIKLKKWEKYEEELRLK
jgi:hypothetical protein